MIPAAWDNWRNRIVGAWAVLTGRAFYARYADFDPRTVPGVSSPVAKHTRQP
jgi:hypothetical protein